MCLLLDRHSAQPSRIRAYRNQPLANPETECDSFAPTAGTSIHRSSKAASDTVPAVQYRKGNWCQASYFFTSGSNRLSDVLRGHPTTLTQQRRSQISISLCQRISNPGTRLALIFNCLFNQYSRRMNFPQSLI